ncbi:MAG: MarR family winged helix-turn-helix transcriptional regulator [Pikeienuella sp.]
MPSGKGRAQPGRRGPSRPDQLRFLTDEQLRQGIELLFFAYRDHTADPDGILAERGLGRAHHRAIHFIKRRPGITVAGLQEILRVTKQSLNRVLRQLVDEGLVESREGTADRRQRHLTLSETGEALERALSEPQRARLRRAYASAGPEAVAGFRTVLEQMLDQGGRDAVLSMVRTEGDDRG